MSHASADLILDRLPHLRSYARALTRDRVAAEDLVQDAIVRIMTSIDRFDGSNFGAWSGTILRNRFIDNCRRARHHGGSIEDLAVPEMTEEPNQDSVVELDETLRVFDDLSPNHREILTLICINEFSYSRTARLLDIPVGTVRSRLSRARAELHAAVESDDDGQLNGEMRQAERKLNSRPLSPACRHEANFPFRINGCCVCRK